MTTPISFTVRPPSAPYRPSPLGNGHANGNGGRAGAPSRRMFEAESNEDDEEDNHRSRHRNGNGVSSRDERVDGLKNGRTHGYVRIRYSCLRELNVSQCRSSETPVQPLVIPALPNKDWRQSSSRRTPSYRPEVRLREDEITQERIGDGPQRSGLRFAGKEEKMETLDDGTQVKTEIGLGGSSSNGDRSDMRVTRPQVMEVEVKSEPLSLEQQALAAILAGDVKRESQEEQAQRELVIGMESAGSFTPLSEEDAFRRDMATLPEEVCSSPCPPRTADQRHQSTLKDYESIPVSAFGLAMARGMGWNPKANDNTALHEPKMRPQLLGLGATPMDTTIQPTHGRSGSTRDREKKRAERAVRGGRGYVATGLLLKREKEGGDGSFTLVTKGSGRGSPEAEGSGSGVERRKREDGDDSERDSKRRNGDSDRDRSERSDRSRYDNVDRDRRRERDHETEEERAKRKAKERERERDRRGDGSRHRPDERDRNGREDRDSGDRDRGRDDRRDREYRR
jgi:hypothetical protein